MPTTNNPDLFEVDWSNIPAPVDDGGARHLEGLQVHDLPLRATNGSKVSLGMLAGRVVVYAYPRTRSPGQIALVDERARPTYSAFPLSTPPTSAGPWNACTCPSRSFPTIGSP